MRGKKVFSFIVGFVLALFLMNFIGAEVCIDEDGGKDIYTASSAGYKGGHAADNCRFYEGNNFVMEAVCASSTEYVFEKIMCPEDTPYCNKGKCSNIEIKPTDSDGGNNPKIKGAVNMNVDEGRAIEDSCSLNGHGEDCSGSDCSLKEYYISGGALKVESYECLQCEDGACLKLKNECSSLGDNIYECSRGDRLDNVFCSGSSGLEIFSMYDDEVTFKIEGGDNSMQFFSDDGSRPFHVMCGFDDFTHTVSIQEFSSEKVIFSIEDFDSVAYKKAQDEEYELFMDGLMNCKGCFADRCYKKGELVENVVCNGEVFVELEQWERTSTPWKKFVNWLSNLF